MKIYSINLDNIDYTELFPRLQKIGYKELYMNEMSFCPNLIIMKDPTENNMYVYENVNDGFLNSIKKDNDVIIDTDMHEFIIHARNLKNGIAEVQGLF